MCLFVRQNPPHPAARKWENVLSKALSNESALEQWHLSWRGFLHYSMQKERTSSGTGPPLTMPTRAKEQTQLPPPFMLLWPTEHFLILKVEKQYRAKREAQWKSLVLSSNQLIIKPIDKGYLLS